MAFVSAHDLETGAAFILPGSARCVPAHLVDRRHSLGQTLDGAHVDPDEVMPIASFPPGTIVYAELQGTRRWQRLRLVAPH